jgi:hypothetical protein
MQPDGLLHPSAEPKEEPDPSDSADSYWLARTIWALGEGYAAFARTDHAFARFLADRIQLALDALDREVLDSYGKWLHIDGALVPEWLIAGGADATGEALLGLSAYVRSSGDKRARTTLRRLAEGVAAMRAGTPRTWPYGAVLPWSLSRADWHAWGGLAPAGLARSYDVLGEHQLGDAALSDTASFTPHLLIAAGPQSRVECLLAAAAAGHRPALRLVAGMAAAWFFGNNPAGTPMYDSSTGRTYDGVDGAGKVNQNSGAESSIHGLLATLALDGAPDVAAVARSASVTERVTWRLVEAEAGTLTGDASVHRPASAWTGESLWSNGAGVRLGAGGQVVLDVVIDTASVLMPAVELSPDAGTTRWSVGSVEAGRVDHGMVGPQGDSPAPGLLSIQTLPRTVTSGTEVTVTGGSGTCLVDAVLVQPEVERLVLSGGGHATALLRSFGTGTRTTTVAVPGSGKATVVVYDETGRTVHTHQVTGATVTVGLPAGGGAVVRR